MQGSTLLGGLLNEVLRPRAREADILERLVAVRHKTSRDVDAFVVQALGRVLAQGGDDGRVLRFVLRYLTAVATDLNGPKTRNPALLALDWCLQRCSAANKAVRVRLLVFAGQLLEAFHGTYMDSGFGEYASERLCALLEDRVGEVRVEAAKCLAWLPSLSATCVVALTDAVQDGDAAVRVQALKTVGATASQADWQPALDALVERTRDDDEAVRGEAYGVLGRLQASWFSAEQMRAVVRSGLHGAADSARDQCALLVLSSWLPHHHNDPEVLLGALCDVDTSPEALDALIDALVAGGLTLKQAYFRERIDALSVPLVKLWATAAAHLPADERESLLPPLAVLVKVLLHYADEPALFEALCALVPLYDLSLEEAARADLSSALRHIMGADSDEVLPSVRTAAQRTLMCLHPDPLDWAQLCLETVSDLVDADVSEGVATPQWMAALVLATGLLQEPRLGLHVAGVAQLRALVLLPSLQTADPAQRTTAVRALGVYCTLSIEHAVEFTRLFATVLNSDVAQVRAEATRVLLDLCLLFGCSYAERLDEAALAELARGPTLPDELNPVLARVLAPLAADEHRNQGDDDDDDDAVHLADLEQAAWVGVAKMLLHDRLHSPPLLGRVLAKAAAGDAQMAHFARLYQERLPQINTPRLRRAIKWAAPRVRGGEQGKALHALALQWNVSCDDVAADALAKGGDPEALHTFCGGGDSPASDTLRQAMLAAAEANKSAAYLRALFDWCHDRHVHLPLAGAAVEPAAKKAKSNNQRHKASTKRARAPEAPTAALAKRSHVIDDQLQRETAKWHASNAGIDDFELGVEVATTPLRKPAARPAPVLVEDGPPPAPRAAEFDDDDHAVPAEDKDATIAALRKRLREAEQLVEQQLRKRQQQQQQQDHYQQHVESVETPVHLPIRAVHADDERTLATGPASGAMAAVSGVSARNDVYRMMEAVGLRPYAQAGWSNKITHLICGDLPAPTSKTVAAALCGAWLCPLSWLQACASAGHLVDESSHGCWRRPRRLLLQRSVWLSPAFCHEKRDHFSLATVESLVYTLGLAVRVSSPHKADVVLVAKSEPTTAYGDASVYTWASLTAELTTPPLGPK